MHLGERGVSSVFSSLDPPRAPLSTPYSLSITYQMDRQFYRISTKKVKERKKKHNQDGLSIGSTAKKVKMFLQTSFRSRKRKIIVAFPLCGEGKTCFLPDQQKNPTKTFQKTPLFCPPSFPHKSTIHQP